MPAYALGDDALRDAYAGSKLLGSNVLEVLDRDRGA